MTNAQPLSLTWRILKAVAGTLKSLLRCKIDAHGLRHVPTQGGAILAFNHHSYADFIALAWTVVVETGRPVRFVGKKEVVDSKWIGWLARKAGVIPVDRGSAEGRAYALDRAIEAAAQGDLVAVAPEQTISASFELLPFRSGVARMAQRAGVAIIPVVGWGSQRFATYGIPLRPRFGIPVTVDVGEPMTVSDEDDPADVTASLQATMATMLDRAQRRYPDGMPQGARWLPARLGGSAPPHEDVLAQHRDRGRQGRIAPTDSLGAPQAAIAGQQVPRDVEPDNPDRGQ